MDRSAVVRVIRDLAERLSEAKSQRAPVERARDPDTARIALAAACRENGISLDDYEGALKADLSLADLARQATTFDVVESPDPGPYDAISRESPSGQPGDLTKSRSAPRVPSGGS